MTNTYSVCFTVWYFFSFMTNWDFLKCLKIYDSIQNRIKKLFVSLHSKFSEICPMEKTRPVVTSALWADLNFKLPTFDAKTK